MKERVEVELTNVPASEAHAIAASDSALDYRPALRIEGGKDFGKPGEPAYGLVESVRMVGNKLVAYIVTHHAALAAALRARKFQNIKSEIYQNLRRDGKKFGRALKSVIVHGISAPANVELVPSGTIQFNAIDYDAIKCYSASGGGDPGAEVDRLVKRYMLEHPTVTSYRDAQRAVQVLHPDVFREYEEQSNSRGVLRQTKTVGVELSDLVKAQMKETGSTDYAASMAKVVRNPEHESVVREYCVANGMTEPEIKKFTQG